jgi:hypothetical protein
MQEKPDTNSQFYYLANKSYCCKAIQNESEIIFPFISLNIRRVETSEEIGLNY